MRINIGCGMSPTENWINFDNSFSIKLSKYPTLIDLLYKLGLLNSTQLAYTKFCQSHNIKHANATKHIPLNDNSVDVIYSSHMLEHLDQKEAILFLNEAKRVLKPGGVIRLAIPDLSIAINQYNNNNDADAFVEKIHMGLIKPKTLLEKFKLLFIGTRHHHWMYDGKSLCNLLSKNNFFNCIILPAGQTTINNPDKLNLNEYEGWSVYVEAKKP